MNWLKKILEAIWAFLTSGSGASKETEAIFIADWPNAEWTKLLSDALDKHGKSLLSSMTIKDGATYNFQAKTRDERKQFWIYLLSSMARFESGFKPETSYKENFKDSTGAYVISRGLFQLSYESVRGYGVKLTSQEQLHDPKTNIEAAVIIMDRWVGRDELIGTQKLGGARYWSVLRETNPKRSEIIAKMKAFKMPESKPETEPKEGGMYRNKAVLLKAAEEIGVKEASGSANNERVVEYHKAANASNTNKQPDSVPWCASFICWVLETVGMGSTNSMMARSYEGWGVNIPVSQYLPGDIIVFYRNGKSSGQGHVSIVLKVSGNYAWCLGGNQSDAVNITKYSLDKMTSIRRSSKAGEYSEAQKQELVELAEKILAGETVQEAGSVV